MKNKFIYFADKRTTFVHTMTAANITAFVDNAAAQVFAITGQGIDPARAEMVIKITSAADNTGNRGSAYTNANTTAGEVTTITAGGATMSSANLTIDKKAQDGSEGQDTANGYNLKVNDVITITFVGPLEDDAACFNVSAFKGVKQTNATTTVINFASASGAATVDTVTLTHTTGKFNQVVNYLQEHLDMNVISSTAVGVFCSLRDTDNGGFGAYYAGPADLGITNAVIVIA
jgi:hypothetical protein